MNATNTKPLGHHDAEWQLTRHSMVPSWKKHSVNFGEAECIATNLRGMLKNNTVSIKMLDHWASVLKWRLDELDREFR
jgi:hypothetical protein